MQTNIVDWKKKLAILVVMESLMIAAALGTLTTRTPPSIVEPRLRRAPPRPRSRAQIPPSLPASRAVDISTGSTFHLNGIQPRSTDGLFGIFMAPFLHLSLSQLLINSVPFLLLGGFVLMRRRGVEVFALLAGLVVLGGGLLVWAFGRDMNHIGSSCLVFGFFGYLLLFGALVRDWRNVIIAVVVFLVYGTTLLSMFSDAAAVSNDSTAPATHKVSWDYMLAGLACGLLVSVLDVRYIASHLDYDPFPAGVASSAAGALFAGVVGAGSKFTPGDAATAAERAKLTAENDDLLEDDGV